MNIADMMTATTNKIAPLTLYPSIAWPKPGMKNEKIPLVTASLSTKLIPLFMFSYYFLGLPKYILCGKYITFFILK